MFALLLLAGSPGGGAAGNPLITFLPLILIFVVFYFFLIRPQKKKEDERKKMIEAVKKGDRVVTVGGIHGTILEVDEASVLAQVDANTKLRFDKSSVASVRVKE